MFGLKRALGLDNPHLRYAAYRWILPRLGDEPLANINLAEKAWPKVSALTAAREYASEIDSVEWGSLQNGGGIGLLRQRAESSNPIVLRGYFRSADSWTLERIKDEVGDTVGPVRVGDYPSMAGDPDLVRMRVADFIDFSLGRLPFPEPGRIVEGLGPYLANIQLPEVAKQLPQPDDYFPKAPMTTFWLGVDSFTPLHAHQFCDVLLVQITGRRRVMLVPPHQAPLVGCVPRNINICTATFDPFEPESSPGAGVICSVYCDLEPGDALLIPGFWFHTVRLTGASFSGSQFNEALMPLAIGGGPRRPWQERALKRGWS